MKLLLNDKEIAHFLNDNINLTNKIKDLVVFKDTNLQAAMNDFLERDSKRKKRAYAKGHEYIPQRMFMDKEGKYKYYLKLKKAITRDLESYFKEIKEVKIKIKEENFHGIHKNIETFINRLGQQRIFNQYKKSKYNNFVKGTGLTLTKNPQLIRRKDFNNYEQDCLIRNTVGNENLLVTKIDKKYPMWFIDSGYTNFLEPNKKWHRLVRNHLHYGNYFDAPADRLSNIKEFPLPWRKDGEIIYIIEPGPFAASIFHCNLKTWKYEVAKELRKHTDKRIVFRKKAPLRQRPNLRKQLMNDDYHCVISINSNAATEAIWCGVPAITLGTHITNPVSRNKLSDINDLYYGNLGNWLCMLSYSQFTKEELMDGTAKDIIGKYHG